MKFDIKQIVRDIPKKTIIYILGAVGVLLLVLPSFLESEEEETVIEEDEDYCAALEARLEELLPRIAGVGEVDVMVTAKNYGEVRLAEDEDDGKKSVVIMNEKGGGEKVEVIEEYYPEIQGVVVAAEGGKSSSIKESVTEAVSALLGIEAHKIKVFEREHDG
ncbi:MAG: hypothetical protein LUG52_04345 [Clostridia bacterium]|nr:hypothetical protein [Clostridia bacterium]